MTYFILRCNHLNLTLGNLDYIHNLMTGQHNNWECCSHDLQTVNGRDGWYGNFLGEVCAGTSVAQTLPITLRNSRNGMTHT